MTTNTSELSESSDSPATDSHESWENSAWGRGLLVWFPIVGSIAAWAVHLVGVASVVQFTCNAPSYSWTPHALTVICLAVAGAALLLGLRLLRGAGPDDSAHDAGGRRRFIGRFAVLIASINIALILLEELYVTVLHNQRCH